ncbi:ATP-binding cassette domain-containing protein [Brevibacterium album]|uniref:ATP-binding cassette domain-containing protein n=1 Tax=Brevibacterium album TaxID=417948 RepID=UPI00146F9F43|nr:ATP-binding cassette domain-containing protein [Brevibacterium album]
MSVKTSETVSAEAGTDPVISIEGLSLSTPRSVVYAGVSAEIAEGGLLVFRGAEGSGKTALLLSAAGRMRPDSGTVTVGGADARRQGRTVRRLVGLSHVHGVTDLEDNLTVAEHIAERLITRQPWYRPWISKSAVAEEVDRLRATVVSAMSLLRESGIEGFRPADVLEADFVLGVEEATYVSELTPLQRFFLELALTSIDRTPFMAIDDIDLLRDPRDRTLAWLGVLLYRQDGVFRDGAQTFVVTCADDAQLRELCERVPQLAGGIDIVDLARPPV